MLYYGDFRLFCQKVLPTVYDDSLSYYEVLCKLTRAMSDFSTDLEGFSGDLEQLKTDVDELKRRVDTELEDINKRIDDIYDEIPSEDDIVNIINRIFNQMLEDGSFPDYAIINKLTGYNKSVKPNMGISRVGVIRDTGASVNGLCIANGNLYTLVNENNTTSLKKYTTSYNLLGSVDLGENTYAKTVTYDYQNNRVMCVDSKNKYIYYIDPSAMVITGVLKYNRYVNDLSNILTFDVFKSGQYAFTIPYNTNDILIYSYNATSNIYKLFATYTLPSLGGLNIIDTATTNNMLCILAAPETTGDKYNNATLYLYRTDYGFIKRIVLPNNIKYTGVTVGVTDVDDISVFYFTSENGGVYYMSCDDDIAQIPSEYNGFVNSDTLITYSPDEYGYVEDVSNYNDGNDDYVIHFPKQFYTVNIGSNIDRVNIGTAILDDNIGYFYLIDGATPKLIYNIITPTFALKIAYSVSNSGLCDFTSYEYKDDYTTSTGDLAAFKSNIATLLIGKISNWVSANGYYNQYIYIGLLNSKYKSGCLYSTPEYKGSPYNTIACIPLNYTNDDRIPVGITITATPNQLGTTLQTSQSSQGVGVTTLSGAAIYQYISQNVLLNGDALQSDILTVTVNDSTVSVSGVFENSGVYTGGFTVRGTTGTLNSELYIPITVNAVTPEPPQPTNIIIGLPDVGEQVTETAILPKKSTAAASYAPTKSFSYTFETYNGDNDGEFVIYTYSKSLVDSHYKSCFVIDTEHPFSLSQSFIDGKSSVNVTSDGTLIYGGIIRKADLDLYTGNLQEQATSLTNFETPRVLSVYGNVTRSSVLITQDVMPLDPDNIYYPALLAISPDNKSVYIDKYCTVTIS